MGAYDRRVFRGVTLNERTIAMILTAEKQLGFELVLPQGSYRPATSYSGTTHTGGGAVDISLSGMSYKRKLRTLRVLKSVGFAAWWRTTSDGPWIEHIHALAIGDKELAADARWQVDQYRLGYNGLSAGVKDRNPWRPDPIPTFSYKKYLAELAEARMLARLRDQLRALVRKANGLKSRIASKRDDIEKLRKH